MANTIKMTIAGNTFKAREKMKSEGFVWDADSKSWSRDYVNTDRGFEDANGNYKGTEQSIRHMVECYAKSDKFTITIEAA